MLWRGIMGFTKFGDKRVNDLDLLSGYVVGVACLHRENPCRRICMQLASILYLSFLFAMLCSSSFCCIFMYKPQTNLVNVCAQLISLRNEHFFGDTFDVLCFHMYKLQASLCCAFYWRKPCHDHTFDLLCFHMYKPQSNLNSRQRR